MTMQLSLGMPPGPRTLELARLAQDHALHVFVTQTFPLAQAAGAHRAIMDGHTTGKIVLLS